MAGKDDEDERNHEPLIDSGLDGSTAVLRCKDRKRTGRTVAGVIRWTTVTTHDVRSARPGNPRGREKHARLRTLFAFGAAVLLLLVLLAGLGPNLLVRELAAANLRIFALGFVAVLLARRWKIEALRRLLATSGALIPMD